MVHPSELKRVSDWSCKDILFCIALDDDSRRLWVGSSDARVYEIDLAADKPVESRQPLQGEGHSSYVTGMARNGNTLVTCSYDQRLIWWDLGERQQVRSILAHDRWIRQVVITPDAQRVITVADDMRCHVWDFQSGDRIADFSDHAPSTPHHFPSMLYAVDVSPDGKRIATGDKVGHVAIWDAQTYDKVGELEAPVMYTWDPKQRRHSIGGIRSLAFSADGQKLAVGGIGKIGNIDHLGGPARMEVFDLNTGDRLFEVEDNNKKGLVEQILWGPDDAWIMTVGGDNNGFVTVYNSDTAKILHQADQGGHVHALCHDASLENLFLAGHQKLSRWTMNSTDDAPS